MDGGEEGFAIGLAGKLAGARISRPFRPSDVPPFPRCNKSAMGAP